MKEKVLNWAQRFNIFCFLDNHHYHIEPHTQECLLAAGVKRKFTATPGQALSQLAGFMAQSKGWLFGHLGYDLKNELEPLASSHPDRIGFPDIFLFEPEVLIRLSNHSIVIEAGQPMRIQEEIDSMEIGLPPGKTSNRSLNIQARVPHQEYLDIIHRLRQHIIRGDCYEINYCQEFFAEDADIDPLNVYRQLSAVSPNPFSALYRQEDHWLICASPERFLKKEGTRILSQPIKGTSGRVLTDELLDAKQKEDLYNSAKDRSENIMVVDLVRNDLAKICEEGSVKVDELYGIYSFPQVHQMMSTISGELREGISFIDVLKATFPMGSMTGAPKKSVMQLIERYETSKRGIFSGAMGYISPNGDFDFNVVIRSIIYNSTRKYLSFPAGSGITFYSDPQKEWEECMMKAAAIKQVLGA